MSEAQNQATPASAPAPVVPAAPKTAIQVVEEQIMNFIKQREQAIANVHAIEGALQASQHLLGVLRTEEAKAVAAVKAAEEKAKADAEAAVNAVKVEAEKIAGAVEAGVEKGVAAVEAEAKKL